MHSRQHNQCYLCMLEALHLDNLIRRCILLDNSVESHQDSPLQLCRDSPCRMCRHSQYHSSVEILLGNLQVSLRYSLHRLYIRVRHNLAVRSLVSCLERYPYLPKYQLQALMLETRSTLSEYSGFALLLFLKSVRSQPASLSVSFRRIRVLTG